MNKYLLSISLILLSISIFAQSNDKVVKEETITTTYRLVEKMPIINENCKSLEGEKLNKCTNKEIDIYLKTIHYPSISLEKNQKGKAYISFVVDVDGGIIDIRLLKSCGYPLLDTTALEHFKKLPAFYKPGHKSINVATKVRYTIPVVFGIS